MSHAQAGAEHPWALAASLISAKCEADNKLVGEVANWLSASDECLRASTENLMIFLMAPLP
jgi:hypothetical protein